MRTITQNIGNLFSNSRDAIQRTGVLNVLRNTVATEIATDPPRRISALDSNWRLFRL